MTALTTPPAGEEKDGLIKRLQDMRNELHVNELRNSGSADGNIYSRWGSIVSQATIALLSSPRVERERALEEAAKAVSALGDHIAEDTRDRHDHGYKSAIIGAVDAIRSLSPQGG